MKNMLLLSLACGLALSGCASVSPVRECPTPQEVPKELMEPAPVDFLQRMRNFCCESDETPTKSPEG